MCATPPQIKRQATMKFVTKKDIEAPIDQVWAALSDFEGWERAAMRRGADVARTDTLRSPGVGMAWQGRFQYRGKDRKTDVKLTELVAKTALGFTASSAAIESDARVELIEMSAKRTRLHVTMEVKPRSLGARLFLQSLRLARAKVDRKFETRVSQLAEDLESRFRHPPRKV